MILVNSGINRVRAFALAGGIGADGGVVNEPLSVLVKWRSEHEDKLHQIYVNGELAGVTTDCLQRMIVILVRSSLTSSAQIEVYAVEPGQRDVDFGVQLESAGQVGRVMVSWPRLLSLPYEGEAEVFSNGGSGEIDYENAITRQALRLWPGWQDKGGFGLSRFGMSDFGFDGSAAIGFGKGLFGYGEFGFDVDQMSWVSNGLETGSYKFAVKITDEYGNSDEDEYESAEVAVIRVAQGAEELEVDSYDKGEGKLVLGVN